MVLPVVRWPWFRDVWFKDYSNYVAPMERAMREMKNAIVLHKIEMAPAIFNPRPWDLASQNVIVARDWGPPMGQELLEHYPGRTLYRWNTKLQQAQLVAPDPHRVTLKGEAFFPADKLRSAYASPAKAPEGYCLKMFGYKAGAQTEVRTHFRGGTFTVAPRFWSGKDGGLVRLELDGRVLVDGLDLYAAKSAAVAPPPATVRLAGDTHVLRLIVRGKNPESDGYSACLDRIVLDRTDAAPASAPASQAAAR
jgi:hypothetical protein